MENINKYRTVKKEGTKNIYYAVPRLSQKLCFGISKNSQVDMDDLSSYIMVYDSIIMSDTEKGERNENIRSYFLGRIDKILFDRYLVKNEKTAEKLYDHVTEYIRNDYDENYSRKDIKQEDDRCVLVLEHTPETCDKCRFYYEETVHEYSALVPVCGCLAGGFKDVDDLRYQSFKGKKPVSCPLKKIESLKNEIKKELRKKSHNN